MRKFSAGKILGCAGIASVGAASIYIAVALLGGGSGSRFGGNLTAAKSSSGMDSVFSPPNERAIDSDTPENSAHKSELPTRAGSSGPVDPVKLRALLPKTIGSYERVAVKTIAAGLSGTRAEGIYESGSNHFTLSIHDQALMGALTSLGAAFGAEERKETADGYDRTIAQDGTRIHERWSKRGNDGAFGRMIGNRFMVEAEGRARTIDELKAAVAAVDSARLVGLAN